MPHQAVITLEITVIDELAKMGLKLPIDFYGNWHWVEKEISFEGEDYYIGAYVKRDEVTRSLEICGQQCLLKQ